MEKEQDFGFFCEIESNLWLRWAMVVSFLVGFEVTEDVIMLLSSVYMKYALHLIKSV